MSDAPELKFKLSVDLHAKGGSKYLISATSLLFIVLAPVVYALYVFFR
jgi:hypothetical protein